MNTKEINRVKKIPNLSDVHKAALQLCALRSRHTHPNGLFDNAGRFYLADMCDCCVGLRSPSRAYPFSQMVHGRSALHVATRFGVDKSNVSYVANLIDADPSLQQVAAFDAAIVGAEIEKILKKAQKKVISILAKKALQKENFREKSEGQCLVQNAVENEQYSL
jgi:ribosomal protein L12E/L44/L45/RPP1/RPP2